jgi:hypothetical protein
VQAADGSATIATYYPTGFSGLLPAVGDVRFGTAYNLTNSTGTLVLPAIDDVQIDVQYGAGGTEFTGTLEGGGDPAAIAQAVWEYTTRGLTEAVELDSAITAQLNAIEDNTDASVGYLTTLLDRVTTGVVALWADLRQMIVGTGTVHAQWTEKALQLSPAAEGGEGGLTEQQSEQLAEIHAVLLPEDPETPTPVITPGTGEVTTGWLVCLDETGQPEAEVRVYARLVEVPDAETGFAHSSQTQEELSAENGVVEFSLIKGASYFVWRGRSNPPQTMDPVSIPSDAGSTYELPSVRAV